MRRGVSAVALAIVLAVSTVAGAGRDAGPRQDSRRAEIDPSVFALSCFGRLFRVRKAERRHVVRFRAIDGVRLIGVVLGHGPRGVRSDPSRSPGRRPAEPVRLAAVRASARGRRLPRARLRPSRLRLVGLHLSQFAREPCVDFDVLGAIRILAREAYRASCWAAPRLEARPSWARRRRPFPRSTE